jgi:hypothetical protein
MILLTRTQRAQLLANGRQRGADHGDVMFGLADIGCPELGSWSLEELRGVRLPFGMGIERDLLFTGDFPISVWAEAAWETGSIQAAERALYRAGAAFTRTSTDTESRES